MQETTAPRSEPSTASSQPSQDAMAGLAQVKKSLGQQIKENVAPELFAYHEQRMAGRIEQREDWGWGHNNEKERERVDQINNRIVSHPFHKINWNKDAHFTGRGGELSMNELMLGEVADAVIVNHCPTNEWATGEIPSVGPKGETLEEVTGPEPPTAQSERDLWKAVDEGRDEGVDPRYRAHRNRPSHEDNEGPLGETRVQDDDHIGPLGEGNENNTDADIGPPGESREEADVEDINSNDETNDNEFSTHDLEGNVIGDEKSQIHRESSSLPPSPASSEAGSDIAPSCGMKRSRSSFEDDADALFEDEAGDDTSAPCPKPKRLRTSSAWKSEATPERHRNVYTSYEGTANEGSGRIASPPATNGSEKLQRVDEAKLRELRKIGATGGIFCTKTAFHTSSGTGGNGTQKDPGLPESRGTKRSRADEEGLSMSKRSRYNNTNSSDKDRGEVQIDPTGETRPVRPTFYGSPVVWSEETKRNEFIPDNNEADDWVVIAMKDIQPGEYGKTLGSAPATVPSPRSWTAQEEEQLRFWVQDYGIQRWGLVAWCLRRTEKDCQDQYRKIVRHRNFQLGRDLNDGLPGWVDVELQLPAAYHAREARDKARRQARLEAEMAKLFAPKAVEERPIPAVIVKSEPEPWPKVVGEEPEFLFERRVGTNEEAKGAREVVSEERVASDPEDEGVTNSVSEMRMAIDADDEEEEEDDEATESVSERRVDIDEEDEGITAAEAMAEVQAQIDALAEGENSTETTPERRISTDEEDEEDEGVTEAEAIAEMEAQQAQVDAELLAHAQVQEELAQQQAHAQAQAQVQAQQQAQAHAQALAQQRTQAQAQVQARPVTAASVRLQAKLDGPPSSRLRPRNARTTTQLGHGLIRYDPKAKAFPKVTRTGALVDSKGHLLAANQGVTGSSRPSPTGGPVIRGRVVKRTC